jgi:hypothetical protein
MTDLSKDFEKLWVMRINQEIDSSLIFFCHLKKNLNLDSMLTMIDSLEKIKSELKTENENNLYHQKIITLITFESSLARAQRNNDLSQNCIEYIEKNFDISQQLQSFYFQFEKGISLYVNNDWIEALSFFIRAEKLSLNEVQKTSTILNIILCHENLDLPFDNIIKKLETAILLLDKSNFEGLHFQFESLILRQKWRHRKLANSDYIIVNSENINQKTYFLMYQKILSFNLAADEKNYLEIKNDLEHFVHKTGHLFNKKIRLNTLLGRWNEADKNTARWTDHIERLYLWCWRWIESKSKEDFTLFVKALSDLPWENFDEVLKLSVEDQSVLILVFGWLSYYDNQFMDLAYELQKKLKWSDENLQYNRELYIQKHLIQNSTEFIDTTDPIFQLAFIYKEKINQQLDSRLMVDYKNNKIKKQDSEIHSKSLSRALIILKSKLSVKVEELFNFAINCSEYDDFLNSQQLSNLTFKLNQWLQPYASVCRKQGYIHLSGTCDYIEIVNFDARIEALQMNPIIPIIVKKIRNNLIHSIAYEKKLSKKWLYEISLNDQIFSRLLLQKKFNLSKTESLRLLNDWLRKGWIQKKGFGKNTNYKIISLYRRTA